MESDDRFKTLLAQSQTCPFPLALRLHVPAKVLPHLGAISNRFGQHVSGLLNPQLVSLHQCRLTTIRAGSAAGGWRRKHALIKEKIRENHFDTMVTLTYQPRFLQI